MILSQMFYHKRPCNLKQIHNLILLKQSVTKSVIKRLDNIINLGLITLETKANNQKRYTLNFEKLPKLSDPAGYLFASDFANGLKPKYIELIILNKIKYHAFNNKKEIHLSRSKLSEDFKLHIPETNLLNAVKDFINCGYIERIGRGKFKVDIEAVITKYQHQADYFKFKKVSANFLIVDNKVTEVSDTLYKEATKQDKKIPVYSEYVADCGNYELAIIYNQIKFSYKKELTIEEIEELISIDWHKNTTRGYLKRLVELGYIKQRNDTINGASLYSIDTDLSSDNMTLLALIEEKDIKQFPHYLTSAVLNFFREAIIKADDKEISISAEELYNRLGGEKSSSTVSKILLKLTSNDYLSSRLDGRKYSYKVNTQKIINILNAERFNKQVTRLTRLYKKYSEICNAEFTERKVVKTIKRLLIDTASFSTLQHIMAYLIKTSKNGYLSIDEIRDSYHKLKITAFSYLQKRTAKSILKTIFQVDNENVESEVKFYSDIDIWEQVEELISKSNRALMKWYSYQRKYVEDIELDDYIQEARILLFNEFKQYPDKPDGHKLNTIKYKLMDFMNKHRPQNKNGLILFNEDDISDIDYKLGEEDKSITALISEEGYIDDDMAERAELDIKQSVRKLLTFIDERSRSMVIDYYGLNGSEPSSYRKLGRKYNLDASRIHAIIKHALEHFRGLNKPPD